jgi:lipoprotein-anchoring transpeptidase ErfK/SrfK
MNIKSLRLYLFIFVGIEYLLLGVVGLFIVVQPALASVLKAPSPAQEIHWAAVNIPKPMPVSAQATPTQAGIEPTVDVPDPTAGPDTVDDSLFPNDQRWIDVNLSQQQIYAYEGNNLVNSFIVSTGVSDTPTITGEYRIYTKVPLQDMSGPGYYLRDVPWVMFFYQDYGFHGTYWHNNFGTPMSRGCVNLSMDDAAWLYDWASVGTRVNVHY